MILPLVAGMVVAGLLLAAVTAWRAWRKWPEPSEWTSEYGSVDDVRRMQ